MFKLTGAIKVIQETVQVTEKFSKREFVISDTSSMYPQTISFQAAQDKCPMLDGFKVGDEVEVSFNLRGREWTSPTNEVKYFNTLDAWRIEKASNNAASAPASAPEKIDTTIPAATTEASEDDDLPF